MRHKKRNDFWAKRFIVESVLLLCFFMSASPILGKGNDREAYHSTTAYKQAISVQWIGLVFHPQGGTYPGRYKRKLDPQAYFVIEWGAILAYERRIFNRCYLKSGAALYLDCADVPAGFVHLGVHYQLLNHGRHMVSIGLGPTLTFREDWHQFPEYTGDPFFKDSVHGKWQYRFVIFGGIEYCFRITDKILLNYTLIPGGRLIVTSCLGLKFVL